MITGRGPFGNDDLQLLVKAITSTDPTLPSRTSAECAAAIRGLMSRQVSIRTHTQSPGTNPHLHK
jgi:hypothetical protein